MNKLSNSDIFTVCPYHTCLVSIKNDIFDILLCPYYTCLVLIWIFLTFLTETITSYNFIIFLSNWESSNLMCQESDLLFKSALKICHLSGNGL